MKHQRTRLLIVAGLAVMTNGFSLFGIGNASAGALARTLECNTNIARNIEVGETLKRLAGNPPCKNAPVSNSIFVDPCLG